MVEKIKPYANIVLSLGLFLGLYLISINNYHLFHTIAEIFSIVVAFSMFMISWNARIYSENDFLVFLGIAYLFIGGVDLLHTLTFEGMEIFSSFGSNTAVQLWIGSRYLESITLLTAFLLLYKKKRINTHYIFFAYTAVFTLILLAVFYWKAVPVVYIEGVGLTSFKIISEYIICFILLLTLLLLAKNRRRFDAKIYRYLFWSIVLTIASEIFFTLYTNLVDIQNFIGHFLKIISFYLIYKAIIEKGIKKPYDLIFRELKIKEEELEAQAITDDLTGVFNRRAAFDILGKMLKLTMRNQQPLTVCFIDVDNLKQVNDMFGHSEGDNLLTVVAKTLEKLLRDSDFICRIGGDEFLLIFPNCNLQGAETLVERIKINLDSINIEEKYVFKIEFSYGLAVYDGEGEISVDKFIEKADNNMYQNKTLKKQRAVQLAIQDFDV
ncbi:MAG: sensor domain-containing diguanylate cyclase [Bacillota bacterium]